MHDDPSPVDVQNSLVDDHLERIVRDMLPGGRIADGAWIGTLNGGACSVRLDGPKRGEVAFDAGQGPHGSNVGTILSLIWVARGFSNYGQAVWFAEQAYLGLDEGGFTEAQEKQFAARRAQQESSAIRRNARDSRRARQREGDVRAIWEASRPVGRTLAEKYLIGLGIPRQEWPPSLRFNRGLHYSEAGDRWPALLCAVQSAENQLVGLWRIFLNGNTGETAPLQPARLALGPCMGGAVRLGRISDEICVCEGVETGFAVKALLGGKPTVWAALSASGLIGLELPERVKKVEIHAENDRQTDQRDSAMAKSSHSAAAESLAERLRAQGVHVTIRTPPAGGNWLDAWNARRAAAE